MTHVLLTTDAGTGDADSTRTLLSLTTSIRSPGSLDMPCAGADTELFFSPVPAELERAKTLCSLCPLRSDCLDGAVRRAEPWGVWGGEIFENGTPIAKKRGRGRPRKSEAASS